ncbi:MAG: sulfotransferase family protein [Actinobacteria bacterium]|nr:sulfotransferase family protein [Actinomycetota bacterium]
MTGLRVVGAGLGRTGTHSLKLALETLLGAPCYHMLEVFEHPEHVPLWQQAVDTGNAPWDELFRDYAAAVDWPVGSFYREVADAYPDAVVLLSTRDADSWWRSADATIFNFPRMELPPEMAGWLGMITDMMATRFTAQLDDEAAAKAAYERHNAEVRSTIPAERLVEWHPGDGWEPLCDALGVPVPDEPFPHVNTTAEFRANIGLDPVA